MYPYKMIKEQGDRRFELQEKERKAAESLKRIRANCDHDFEDIGNGQQQCTYPECQKIKTA